VQLLGYATRVTNAELQNMNPIFFDAEQYGIADLQLAIDDADTSAPLASCCTSGIPIYELCDKVVEESDRTQRIRYQTEWVHVLRQGAGALLLRHACADLAAIDETSKLFESIIASEKEQDAEKADHFGSNNRIWNSLQKLCLADPGLFLRYHGCPQIDAVCEAWLGPQYQMTAQLNVVRPGGAAQKAHRDYHLGFQGPAAGYVVWQRKEFSEYFEQHFVQLPLKKGDVLFFNPAIFHAAGENRSTDIDRMANLLQVSSPFGRAMENIDRISMCQALYRALRTNHGLDSARVSAAINCCAEGYSFPTNLDTDPPTESAVPQSQSELLRGAIENGISDTQLQLLLQQQSARQKA